MSVRRLLMLLLLVTAMLALPVPAGAGPRTDAAFVRATNADRADGDLRSLWRLAHPEPSWPARSRWRMARKSARYYGGRCDCRALWHNDISTISDRWMWVGQNVGCGSLGSDGLTASVRRIQNAFMASSGHRRNILYRNANLIGVGTYIRRDVIWVTVNFMQRSG